MNTLFFKNKILNILKKIYKSFFLNKESLSQSQYYLQNGEIPWSKGYQEFKTERIKEVISNEEFLKELRNFKIPPNFGYRLDERIVEYTWIFSKLHDDNKTLLDAGSTFNFDYIVNHPKISSKDLSIFTYAPEAASYTKKRISYVYGDLRELPFKDGLFDIVISQSTIEHIDMDNSIYGYDIAHNSNTEKKSYEFIVAIKEMIRVLKSKGTLLLTFPYGKFENHGFFQQFDDEMLSRILNLFNNIGSTNVEFFKYEKEGWRFAEQDEVSQSISFNPHTGRGKLDDNAAHSRAICCINFNKY